VPAYAYPIRVDKELKTIRFDEVKTLDDSGITLDDLKFTKGDVFSIEEQDWGGYIISVSRSKLETLKQRDIRVRKEESYMEEYNRRHTA